LKCLHQCRASSLLTDLTFVTFDIFVARYRFHLNGGA
jgi:hypothetical protein